MSLIKRIVERKPQVFKRQKNKGLFQEKIIQVIEVWKGILPQARRRGGDGQRNRRRRRPGHHCRRHHQRAGRHPEKQDQQTTPRY